MDDKLIRIYKRIDLRQIKEKLIVYGDTSGVCANCEKMDLSLETAHCPGCHAEFSYIAFRNIKVHLPKIHKLIEQRPQVVIIDHDDFKHGLGALKAQDFLK